MSDDDKSKNSASNRIIDMMLGRSFDKILDGDTMIKETQNRISSSLKQGFEYDHSIWVNESADFLRKHVGTKISLFILYADLAGSTKMTLELPDEKVAIIMSSFSQEMGYVIKHYSGNLLKYVGDAVIAFFVSEQNLGQQADNIFYCAKSMVSVINKGINPILVENGYPELAIKIGVDFGKNNIVRYGSDKINAHVDILGAPISVAAKITTHARPNQILVGKDVYEKLHATLKTGFKKTNWTRDQWNFPDRQTGKIYKVYCIKSDKFT